MIALASADQIYNRRRRASRSKPVTRTEPSRNSTIGQRRGARSGGNYIVRYDFYNDLEFSAMAFTSSVELQQYIPFFNERRVFYCVERRR
jgi:hypothetical protein